MSTPETKVEQKDVENVPVAVATIHESREERKERLRQEKADAAEKLEEEDALDERHAAKLRTFFWKRSALLVWATAIVIDIACVGLLVSNVVPFYSVWQWDGNAKIGSTIRAGFGSADHVVAGLMLSLAIVESLLVSNGVTLTAVARLCLGVVFLISASSKPLTQEHIYENGRVSMPALWVSVFGIVVITSMRVCMMPSCLQRCFVEWC